MIVKITANFRRDREARRNWQTDASHFVEICAFAAQQWFHGPRSISVAIPEVIHVARRAFSLPISGFARFRPQRLPRALKSSSTISFRFVAITLAVAAPAGMTKRKTKFQRHDVNGLGRRAAPTPGRRQRDVPTDWRQQLSRRGFAVTRT